VALLGINIDHVATLRQARRGESPSIIDAAQAALRGGADSITVHLREDRRHIQDRDVAAVRKEISARLNLEMAATEEMVRIARVVRPASVCLVPERRQELTTEGGLDAIRHAARLRAAVQKIKAKGIVVSIFIDPDPGQVQAAKNVGADAVELHTGLYVNAKNGPPKTAELDKLVRTAEAVRQAGLILNAGHGLDYDNVGPVAAIAGMNELNIGFSVIARAVFVGLEQAVREMKEKIAAAANRPEAAAPAAVAAPARAPGDGKA
jgi:pyridoxine 5-phosphate synthase